MTTAQTLREHLDVLNAFDRAIALADAQAREAEDDGA